MLDALGRLGIVTPNESGFPIIEVPLADHSEIDRVGRYLFDEGVYTTMAAYPLVPKDEVGFRIQVTAANTDDEVDHLIEVVGSLRERFQLRQTADAIRVDDRRLRRPADTYPSTPRLRSPVDLARYRLSDEISGMGHLSVDRRCIADRLRVRSPDPCRPAVQRDRPLRLARDHLRSDG